MAAWRVKTAEMESMTVVAELSVQKSWNSTSWDQAIAERWKRYEVINCRMRNSISWESSQSGGADVIRGD
jgi:hypothetical protein